MFSVLVLFLFFRVVGLIFAILNLRIFCFGDFIGLRLKFDVWIV